MRNYFITVDGQTPVLFDPNNPPAIVNTLGAVEDWTIENRANDVHDFHIHQVHFLLEAVNGVPVPKRQRQFYDTYQVAGLGGRSLSEHHRADGFPRTHGGEISSIIVTSSSMRIAA